MCPNVRDLFTAGGKSDYIIGTKTYKKVPRILLNLFNNISNILEELFTTPDSELSEYWGIKTTEENKLFDWIELVAKNTAKIPDAKHIPTKKILAQLCIS